MMHPPPDPPWLPGNDEKIYECTYFTDLFNSKLYLRVTTVRREFQIRVFKAHIFGIYMYTYKLFIYVKVLSKI